MASSVNFLLFSSLLLTSLSISFPEVTARTPATTTTTVVVPEATPAVQVEKAAKFSTHNHPSPTTKSSYEEKEPKAQQGYRNEKYGMSDTLFLENGKYFYDPVAEKGYGLYAGIGLKGANHYVYNNYNDEANNYERQNNGENEEYNP
ncbi:protein E6-like [Zingiber officinale]|uniref:Uncharacterized protein n=1 Tax=Zingiber officinale TaxID=94328 RepID=A0A8J5K9C4_ZINOF|nr:protein E6-like [Zingiber officinale]KAG6477375.1 hypothetical protein ZIOFF_066629 [Zingiber officinale]